MNQPENVDGRAYTIIKVSRLIWLTFALVALGVASLVFAIVQSHSLNQIRDSQRIIQERVVPVCLNPNTLDACEAQINAAPVGVVVLLCQIVHNRLDLTTSICHVKAGRDPTPGNELDGGSGRADGPSPASQTAGGDGGHIDGGGSVGSNTPDSPGGNIDAGGGGTDPGGSPPPGGGSPPGGGGPGPEPGPGPAPAPNPDNGTCVLNRLACINVQGQTDDNILPDDINVPALP
jgi:hypothetical protein